MPYIPNWFFGLTPPGWFPDRPREPFFWATNILQTTFTGVTLNVEQVFDKKRDVLIFGGAALIQNNTTSIYCPISGVSTQLLCRLSNPTNSEVYSGGNAIGTISAANGIMPGFVPMESLFSCYQHVGLRTAYWPIPIPVPAGGSILLELINMNIAGVKNIRIAWYTSTMYEEREYAA